MKIVGKKVKKQTKDLAKHAVRQIGLEIIKVPEQSKKQLLNEQAKKKDQEQPLAAEGLQQDSREKGISTEEEKRKIELETTVGAVKIDEEMKKLRELRKKGDDERRPKIRAEAEDVVSIPGEPILPSSPKPKKGGAFMKIKRKQGSRELGRGTKN